MESQMSFTAKYMEGHLNVSGLLEKPLIITEFGKLPPLSERNAFFKFIYSLALASAEEDGPLAGQLTSFLFLMP